MVYEGEIPEDNKVIIDAGWEFMEGVQAHPYTDDDPAGEDTSYLYGLLPALNVLSGRLDRGLVLGEQGAQALAMLTALKTGNCFGQAQPVWPKALESA